MTTINRVRLLADEKLWLPKGNVLDDGFMHTINDSVIAALDADDHVNYAEALCKGLKAIAQVNKARGAVDQAGIKREKVGDVEVEHFDTNLADHWSQFIKSLKEICPIFGYKGSVSKGMGIRINPSPVFDIDVAKPNTGDLAHMHITTSISELTL